MNRHSPLGHWRALLVTVTLSVLAGCGAVAGTPAVGVPLATSSSAASSSARTSSTPPTPHATTTAPSTTAVTAPASTPTPANQVAPADFTAYSDLNYAARWNDSTTDPDFVAECNLLADKYPHCWSVSVWNGSVSCPTGVVAEVDLYDGPAATATVKVGSDFGISTGGAVDPYSITRLLVFTDTVFPSGTGSALITGVRCAL